MPRHFMQTAGNSGVANLLVQAILDDLAARALKTIDAVIETLPGGFPGAVADSASKRDTRVKSVGASIDPRRFEATAGIERTS